MSDKEKVIKGLEEAETMLTQAVDRGGEMSVTGAFKCLNRVTDALALLKEQETEDTGRCRVFQCKKCGFGIDDIFVNDEAKYQIVPRYCQNCGRPVKWNG